MPREDRDEPRRALAVHPGLLRTVCVALAVALPLACDARPPESSGGSLLVSAAASLTDAFAEIEAAFEAAHPTLEMTLNLAGSSTLRAQILEGAPVDVFASADRPNMERLAKAGEVATQPRIFARNRLQIAIPVDNPAGVTGLEDFQRAELLLGLCAEGVPCGDFARVALARAGVVPSIDTAEPDVRALLTKVALGELDAAITYVTDVTAAGAEVRGIDLPDAASVVAEYPIAVLAGASDRTAARIFVDFVLSADGQAILARHDFLPAQARNRPGSPRP